MTSTLTQVEQSKVLRYPIAEIFHSIQGEGFWAGTAMSFIRFAGCSVGKPYTATAREALGLQPYQERCCDWDGNSFPCDTNYRQHARMSVDEILTVVQDAKRVCLTGGEPLIHPLGELLIALQQAGKIVHMETSGTILERVGNFVNWLTVSPKYGVLESMLYQAQELKVLVSESFDEEKFLAAYENYLDKVWAQPVNQEHEIDQSNLQRCVRLVLKYPKIRLSSQLHKLWKVC